MRDREKPMSFAFPCNRQTRTTKAALASKASGNRAVCEKKRCDSPWLFSYFFLPLYGESPQDRNQLERYSITAV